MIERILVAVDDTGPAIAAARFAIGLADDLGATLDVVTVVGSAPGPPPILDHVRAMADRAGVPVTVRAIRDAQPYESILAAALAAGDDLIVMGRTNRRGSGRPYVGSQTEHVLEFAEVPVVTVPEDGSDG